MKYQTIEYSVCESCIMGIANDDGGDTFHSDVERELDGKKGHFSMGVVMTDEDPDGQGYEEFSWRDCELCHDGLGGCRWGATLFIEKGE